MTASHPPEESRTFWDSVDPPEGRPNVAADAVAGKAGRHAGKQSAGGAAARRVQRGGRRDRQLIATLRVIRRAAQAGLIAPPKPIVVPGATRWQRWRAEIAGWLRGVATSAVLHAVLLVLLALLSVRGGGAVFDALNASWSDDGTRAQRETSRQVRTFVPVRIESVRGGASRPTPKAPQAPAPAAPSRARRSAVRPADAGGMLRGRTPDAKAALLQAAGGDDKTEAAIARGLRWLVRQQQPRGNWKLHEGYPDAGFSVIRTDTGATALALLAFLGDGQTHHAGEFTDAVQRGLDWLIGVQKPNGDLHDHVELGRQTAYYAHSQATIALCEALALTGDDRLREPARRAVDFLVASQHPSNGGWRYQPQTEKTMGDLSVTGWALMALHTARRAGLELPDGTFERAARFLDAVQEDGGALYKYMPNDPPDRVSVAMTAEGLLCRQWLGWSPREPAMQRGVRYLLQHGGTPRWQTGVRNVYAWYYVAQVLHNVGGEDWKRWYGEVQREIVAHQVSVGSRSAGKDVLGSWHPTKPVGAPEEYAEKAGRLYVTSMCLLILETPYRHASLYADEASDADE